MKIVKKLKELECQDDPRAERWSALDGSWATILPSVIPGLEALDKGGNNLGVLQRK